MMCQRSGFLVRSGSAFRFLFFYFSTINADARAQTFCTPFIMPADPRTRTQELAQRWWYFFTAPKSDRFFGRSTFDSYFCVSGVGGRYYEGVLATLPTSEAEFMKACPVLVSCSASSPSLASLGRSDWWFGYHDLPCSIFSPAERQTLQKSTGPFCLLSKATIFFR